MISLARAELNRLRSRRAVIVWLIILLVAVAGFQVIIGISARQPSATEIATARQAFQQAQEDYRRHHDTDVKQCQQDNQGQPADFCDMPPPAWPDFQPRPAAFSEMAGPAASITVVFGSLVFLIIGATSIGAEFGSGAIANWLSFIPDRIQVYAAKLGVLIIFSAVLGAVASALTLASTVVLFKINDGPVSHLPDHAATSARGLIVVITAATVGFALALISRHTIAALGAVVGYLVVDFVLNRVMEAVLSLQKIKPWLLENNAAAVLNHGSQYYDQVHRVTPNGVEYDSITRHVSFAHGLSYLLVLLAVAIVVPLLIFRRRDIT